MNKKQMEARIKELEAQVSPKAPVLLRVFGKDKIIVCSFNLVRGRCDNKGEGLRAVPVNGYADKID